MTEEPEAYINDESEIKEGFAAFCISDDWSHNFDKEAKRYAKYDDEATYLSMHTFASLFEYLMKTCLEKPRTVESADNLDYERKDAALEMRPNPPSSGDLDKSKSQTETENARQLLFHFDVMNNPKAARNNFRRIGSMAKRSEPLVHLSFEKIYHTIGNFAPVPWWISGTYLQGQYNLQRLHVNLAEWWDALLLYLQWRMPEFKEVSGISFVDYIILTCQFFYLDIDEEADGGLLRKLHAGSLGADAFCKEVKMQNRKSNTPWTDLVKKWTKALHEKECKIISLAEPSRDEPKVLSLGNLKAEEAKKEHRSWFFKMFWEDHVEKLKSLSKDAAAIEHVDKHIARLIEVRGRCILGLLEEAQKQEAK